jgi:hypothetical protein
MDQSNKQFGIYVIQQFYGLLDADAREAVVTRLKTQVPSLAAIGDGSMVDAGTWAKTIAPAYAEFLSTTFDPAKLRVA